jgi:hypothetical protein
MLIIRNITGRKLAGVANKPPETRAAIAIALYGGTPLARPTIDQCALLCHVPVARIRREIAYKRSIGFFSRRANGHGNGLVKAWQRAGQDERIALVDQIGADAVLDLAIRATESRSLNT